MHIRLPVGLYSLFIQCAALLAAVLLRDVLQRFFALSFPLWSIALVQGGIAAALSHASRQPVWWIFLHLGFLPLVLRVSQLRLPSWIYLLMFLVLVLFYWSSFRRRVPLYLSDRKAWQALSSLLPRQQPFRFIDLGSGFGDVPLYLAPRFPRGQFFGTEIAPAPWLIGRIRAWLRRSTVTLLRRDYTRLDLAAFDVVFSFLSPAVMPDLWRQAQAQMRTGSLFVSLSFTLDARQPDYALSLAQDVRHTLYAWRM